MHDASFAVRGAVQEVLEALATRSPAEPEGLLGKGVTHALASGGKMLRPTLLLAASDTVGGEVSTCAPAAFAVEALHVATLVHDDIMDGDGIRRGRPSVFGAYGPEVALVVGDSLLFASFEWSEECVAAGVPAERVLRSLNVLAQAGQELCRGQMLEEEMARDPGGRYGSYFAMVAGKTAALFAASARIGAILGGARPVQEENWSRIGLEFGTAFQIQDDLIPYRNNGADSGKDPDSDLRNGRLTLPWLTAYESANPVVRDLLRESQRDALQGRTELPFARLHETIGNPVNLARCEAILSECVGRAEEMLGSFDTTEGVAIVSEMIGDSLGRTR